MNLCRVRTFFMALIGSCFSVLLGPSAFTRAADGDAKTSVLGAAEPLTRSEIYGQGVRDSQWQTPEKEQEGFHLAPGFEVNLFASEPMIAKPMNLAFDSHNRLWVTQTVEYPYPATEGTTPKDAVVVLEDTDGDGRADKKTIFADGLNIPIGILPYGQGCLCFSIPNLLYLRDTDGDGVCDQRDVVLGPFDTTRDTHGMVNALRDGGDGWIYACHGFNNQSQVSGTDGHQVTLHSGNTFRFRPDGSRVEHVTHGQVNPFGMTIDEWGYGYSADCHSKPITQLIFGACYPSFGRPHDGLGFLPPMVDHLHGSTAICGIVTYPSDSVVSDLRGQMLSGNVMTSRINRNQVVYHGATAKGVELTDFMTSDDPWFRPVDLQVGMDSHLYVADFYNKIIGHYEVPLQHPERDRESGRIWKIRYTGLDSNDSEKQDNIDQRYLAGGISQQIAKLQDHFLKGKTTADELIALSKADSPQLAVAALRLAGELANTQPSETETLNDLFRAQVTNPHPHLSQVSAQNLGQHGNTRDIPLLLERLEQVDEYDVVLHQTLRIAIRELLRRAKPSDEIWTTIPSVSLASVYLGLDRPEVAIGLLKFLKETPSATNRNELLTHAVKLAPESELESCVQIADQLTAGSADQRDALIRMLLDAPSTRDELPSTLRNWISRHVQERLDSISDTDRIIGWSVTAGGTWPSEMRKRQGGGELSIDSSLGRGETYVGNRVSDHFSAPRRIEFWLAGHNGFPDQPSHEKNRVQLIRASDSSILREALPPRSDVAILVKWDLKEIQGESVQLRIIDGDSDTAYAWLGVGDFQPPWLGASASSEWVNKALELIERVRLIESAGTLVGLLNSERISVNLKFSIARTLAILSDQRSAATLLQYANNLAMPDEIVSKLLSPSFASGEIELDPYAQAICQRLTQKQQLEFARSWVSSGAPAEQLIRFSELGFLSPTVLARPEVTQMLEQRWDDALRERHVQLTQGIQTNQQQEETLKQLQSSLKLVGVNLEQGQMLYTQHCANCHQLGGKGKVVGPQLDGAVTRSVQRLLEDVVTPNRNVDHAFRTTNLLLDDGRVVAGLLTNENATDLSLADPTGKPIQVKVDQVVQRRESTQSLMPNNFAELLKPNEFRDLIGFLKSSQTMTP